MPASATILLFHSAPLVRQVMREILEAAGHVVRATGDLGIAVDMVRETRPDLLMIDVYVANINGHDAALYLRQKCPALRVLFVAGVPDDERLDARITNEGFLIFPPPFAPAQLVARVNEILESTKTPK